MVKRKSINCPQDAFKIFWDLETSDKFRSRIVSIGYCSDDPYFEGELLLLPKVPINMNAIKVHGYTIDKLKKEDAKDTKTQLNYFMRKIESLNKQVVMVAHNGKSFDTHVLRHELEIEDVPIAKNIIGFVDTYHWIKWDLKFQSANLDALMINILKKNARDIHGALEDTKILREITMHLLEKHSNCLGYFENMEEFLARTEKWKSENEIIKDIMEEIIANVETISCDHSNMIEIDNLYVCANCSFCSF